VRRVLAGGGHEGKTVNHLRTPFAVFSARGSGRGVVGVCWLLLATLSLSLCASAWAQGPHFRTVAVGPGHMVPDEHGRPVFRPQEAVADQVVVRLRPRGSVTDVADMLKAVNGTLGRQVRHDVWVVNLPANSDVIGATLRLRAQAAVAVAEPNALVYPSLTPNDPHYVNGDQYHLNLMQCPAGWDVTTGLSSTVIAVIDSGFQRDHPDLQGRVWVNPGEIPNNGIDDDSDGYVDDVYGWNFYDGNNNTNPTTPGNGANDDVSHGTLVASLAAAVTNNAVGVAGINWAAKIMPLKVFGRSSGGTVDSIVSAIDYAIVKHANVINMSLRVAAFYDQFSQPITDAYNAGIVVVCAGGNNFPGRELTNSYRESPVCNDGPIIGVDNHVIGCAATDQTDVKASWSNYSATPTFIDVAAPGVAAYGCLPFFAGVPGFTSYYGAEDGTSFSSPIVAGIASLILAVQPTWTPLQVLNQIRGTADNVDAANPSFAGKLGGGRADVARALGVILPPGPPRNLVAADTLGDNGGSATLTWTKSRDDGAGANSVTGYNILRSTPDNLHYAQLDTKPAGTQTYLDNSTTDGVNYYYKVQATDGVRTADSNESGPVQSRNDSSPALPTTFKALDHPGDNGGQIDLSWDAYTPPADFAGFVIYRETHSFLSTLGLTPKFGPFANSALTGFADTTVTDGVDYFYAIAVRDTAGNEIRTNHSYGPVQSFPNGPVTFAAGIHLLGPPVTPNNTDPAVFFGIAPAQLHYARWVPGNAAYLTYSQPVSAFMSLGLGKGFWINFAAPTQATPDGTVAPAGDFTINLTRGWNQVANPFFGATDVSLSTVTFSGATMDLASAANAGVMAAAAWIWDHDTAQYVMAYPDLGTGYKLIPPWRGFWVLAYQDCQLTLMRPVGAAGVQAAAVQTAGVQHAAPLQVDWVVPLQVRTVTGADSQCFVGAAASRLLLPKPPAATSAALLTLSAPGETQQPTYSVSLAARTATNPTWTLLVSGLTAGQAVRVTAPDLSQLPPDRIAMLQDPASGQALFLRTSGDYVFTPRDGETSRALQLTVSPRSTGQMTISGVSTQQTRGGGAQMLFSLSAPANTTVSVVNIAGRVVRVLEQDKVRTAGLNTVLWDGRNQSGLPTPSGLYLLQVLAQGSSGESVRAVSPLRLTK
jgi:subtilisin family serine protease